MNAKKLFGWLSFFVVLSLIWHIPLIPDVFVKAFSVVVVGALGLLTVVKG